MPPRPPAQHLRRSQAFIAAAVTCLRHGHWESAVGDLYFACFHAALALLATEGLAPTTHRDVRGLLSLHFVMDGPLPRTLGRSFSQLMTDREIAAYSVGAEIDREAALEDAGRALAFLEAALPALLERAPETVSALPDLADLRGWLGGMAPPG